MNRRTAALMARWSERSHGVFGSTPVAHAAWRILRSAAERGDEHAIEAAWREWLGAPDEERWDLLVRWRGPEDLRDALLAAAVDPERPAGERKALGAFCAHRDIAPGTEIDRALFYVLTGQLEQHHAADPGRSLLAAAYRAAGEPVRLALRQAAAESGELDLIRVLAGQRAGR